MNVTTRKQFDQFLNALRTQTIKVFDTETNGLKPYGGNHMISMSVFFPESGEVYNVAFLHGIGQVEVKWTDKYPMGTPFEQMSWQGNARKQVYLSYWFNHFKAQQPPNYFQNLPLEWLDELRAAWGKGVYIGHNTRFDAHVLHAFGFPDMQMVYDTMIALHLVNEDWKHLQFEAPYTYSKENAPSPELVGMWAKDANGKLLKRKQFANRTLKWQAAFHEFEGATDGETSLFEARRAFENTLVDYIMDNIEDPMNDSLLLAKVKSGKATPDDWRKQREKIKSKIEVDDKAHLWMLPSGLVSDYAELDVLLTWKLYEWSMTVIKQWHNEQLWEDQSRIHHFVAWEMERNGFKLDMTAAREQIALLQPRMDEIEAILTRLAMEWGIEEFNPRSSKVLLRFLNSGVLGHDYGADVFPDWWPVELTLELKTYPNIRLHENELDESGDELYGTNKKELERVEDHPTVRMVRELRRMEKSVNTYLRRWMSAADENGIVRFSINDDGTVAGRASSSGDAGNGQNIPDRGGYTIKKAIVPYNEDWLTFAIDYGQLELRIGAWIAEGLLGFDANMTMTNLFLSGEDMHAYVRDMIGIRSILFGEMTDEQIVVKIGYTLMHEKTNTPEKRAVVVADYCRQVAKTMNFGLLYSGGARMLSNLLKMDENVAKVLVNKWRRLFPAFPATQQFITEEALRRRVRPDGLGYGMYYTQPVSGRHRKLHLYDTNAMYLDNGVPHFFNPREAAGRKVWNNTDQGLGGYIAMYSAYRIGEELGRTNIRMFANIHDALEGFVHRDHLHLVPEMGRIMVDWPMIVPNLTVDLQGSRDGTWQGLSKIKNIDTWIATGGVGGF